MLTDENKHDTNSGVYGKYTQRFTGELLNLDKRDPNEATSPCSSSESTAMRGFLVRPGYMRPVRYNLGRAP